MTGALLGAAFSAAFVGVAVRAAYVDATRGRLPDVLTFLLAALGLAQGVLDACGLASLGGLPALPVRLAWCAGTLAVLVLVEALLRALGGRAGLGGGDIKFLAACALWVGPAAVLVLGASCLAALPVALVRRTPTFALGPYLAAFGSASVLAAGWAAPW
jgi:leader peptidase (prepilin peptidase)/N-methyltransferase